MHDPMTVAFEIRWPWPKRRIERRRDGFRGGGFCEPLITVWHVDPETDGTDDSCRWFRGRARWHVHHWKLQIHPLQKLRRWLFTRCACCGQRFSWGYAPIMRGWDRERPGWCRGEKGLYHHECVSIDPREWRPS